MPTPVISVRDLAKRYGRTVAVADVSLDVYEGEIFGLIGPNGAGKTTTMECVQGLRPPDAGSITVLGLDPRRDAQALRQRIGVQHQEAHLQKRIKVWEAVDLWASLYDRERVVDVAALLARLGLDGKRDSWFMTLSGGQKQRLFIALALIHQPEVVFLDELTTGLDPNARHATWELVRRLRDTGVTVVIVSHLMDEVEYLCDRVAILDGGAIVAVDSPAMLTARLGGERTMRFVLAGGASATPDIDFLHALPGVINVRRLGRSVTVTGSRDIAARVEAALAEHQVPITDLRVSDTTLEDAFMSLADPSGERGAS